MKIVSRDDLCPDHKELSIRSSDSGCLVRFL